MKLEETIAGNAYVDNKSTTAAPSLQNIYNPPRSEERRVGKECL